MSLICKSYRFYMDLSMICGSYFRKCAPCEDEEGKDVSFMVDRRGFSSRCANMPPACLPTVLLLADARASPELLGTKHLRDASFSLSLFLANLPVKWRPGRAVRGVSVGPSFSPRWGDPHLCHLAPNTHLPLDRHQGAPSCSLHPVQSCRNVFKVLTLDMFIFH